VPARSARAHDQKPENQKRTARCDGNARHRSAGTRTAHRQGTQRTPRTRRTPRRASPPRDWPSPGEATLRRDAVNDLPATEGRGPQGIGLARPRTVDPAQTVEWIRSRYCLALHVVASEATRAGRRPALGWWVDPTHHPPAGFASRASQSSERDEWVSLRVLRVATWYTAEALDTSVRMGSAGGPPDRGTLQPEELDDPSRGDLIRWMA
jgi:hypothetical protein